MRHLRLIIPSVLAVVATGTVPLVASSAGAASAAPPAVASSAVRTQLAPATDLQAVPTAAGERLHWTDPVGSYTGIVVRRAPGRVAPASPTSGTAIASLGRDATDLVDASVQGGAVYSYSVFATYSAGRHAGAATQRALATTVTAQQSGAQGGASFTGKVTDSAGHPLKGVVVQTTPAIPVVQANDLGFFFYGRGFHQATTAADGTFTISHVIAGSYTLCYQASTENVTGGNSDTLGYADDCPQDPVLATAGAATPLGTVALPGNTGGVVSGRVVDAVSGNPVPFVQIEPVVDFPTNLEITDAAGGFRFALPAGTYAFCVDASSVTTGTGYQSTCTDNQPVTVTAGAVSTLTVPLAAGGVITGVVRSSSDGSPVAGVLVVGEGQQFAQATTGADGSYALYGVGDGREPICTFSFGGPTTASAPYGYGDTCVTVRGAVGSTVAAKPLSLAPAGAITGRVTSADGHPLGGVTVVIGTRRGGFGTTTGGNGVYTMPYLPAATYTVCFDASSYPLQCYNDRPFNKRANPVTVVSGVATTGIDATLAGNAPGAVTVAVVDSHGDVLVGADAVLVQPCALESQTCNPTAVFPRPRSTIVASALTGPDGTATITGLAPGKYAACAFGRYAAGGTSTTRYQDGCASSDYTVVVTSGGSASAQVSLADGAAVTGQVTDRSGHPLADVSVLAATGDIADAGVGAPTLTAQDGTYRVEGLPGGTTRICFSPSFGVGSATGGYIGVCYKNAPLRPTPIPVTLGQVTTGIDQSLTAAGGISGSVTGPDGAPLGNVDVDIEGPQVGAFTQTNPDGTYQVSGLSPGQYVVCFEGADVPDAPPTGYAEQCYNDNLASPTPVKVIAGKITHGIDAQLQVGGEFTGTVTAGGEPLADGVFFVLLRTPNGILGAAVEIVDGSYLMIGVPANKYILCYDGTESGFSGQCYNGVPWDPSGPNLPKGVTKVGVAAAQVVTINVDLGS